MWNSVHLPQNTKKTSSEQKKEMRWAGSEGFVIFLERVCHFSLRSRAIGPSDFDGARRKVVLRGEDNAWAPVS